jgi:hypothetical protein
MMERRTRKYFSGGMVRVQNPTPRERRNIDTIPAQLEENSLVIPRKHVKFVQRFLKENNITLPLSPKRIPDDDIVDAILVKDELIIPKPLAPMVIAHLKRNHIFLPNT